MEYKIQPSQLAVMNIHYCFFPLEHFFNTMQELGVENVDLWSGYPHFYIEEDTYREQAKKILDMSRRSGTKIICCTPEQIRYPINIADPDPDVHARTMAYMHTTLEATAALEAPMYQIVPGRGYYEGPTEKNWACMCDSLGELALHAQKLGITMVLEPLQIIESNLVGSAAAARTLLDDVASPALKIVVDTCHMAVKGESFDHYFELLGDDIAHIHLNESGQVPWGQGDLPLGEYLNCMRRHHYQHHFTLEICSYKHQLIPDEAARDNVQALRAALAAQE